MEGSIRATAIWLVSVLLILSIILGIRSLILEYQSVSRVSQSVVTPSPPFGQPPRYWGVLVNGYGLNDFDDHFAPEKIEALMTVLKDLGVNAVTLPYEALTLTEPNDAVNDVMVAKLTEAGLNIVLLCCDNFSFDVENRYQAAYDFAQRLGRKYRDQIQYFQFVNEISGTAIKPGHSGFTFADYDLLKYAELRELLRGFTDGLASSHPRAKRLISAHWLGIGIMDELIKDRVQFEIVAWHWFSDMGPDPVDILLEAQRGVPAEYDGQRFNLPAHFTEQGKEFWITETNLTSGSLDGQERDQAAYLAHLLEVTAKTEEISGFFYYRLTDGFENLGKSAWGLVNTPRTADGTTLEFGPPKEAYLVYKNFLKRQKEDFLLPFDALGASR